MENKRITSIVMDCGYRNVRATNYADANGPYHWPEGLPWTPREEQRHD